MKGWIVARPMVLTCLAVALAAVQPLDAQFGGLGRRIGDAAKKAAGVESEETAKPAAPTPVAPTANARAGVPIAITPAVLDALTRSLTTEIALKAELFEQLEAREEAVKKHEACKGQAAGSPEFLKILMSLGELPDNAPPEAMQNAMAKMSQDQEALVLKMCGPVPAPINTAERLREIQQKAAAASGPVR
jgi:hypothetical protein